MGNRFRLITVLLIGVVVVAGALFIWAWLGNASRSTPVVVATPRPTREPITAWSAYEEARAAARDWQPDAQVVDVSSSWPNATQERLLGGAAGWTFQFYSPTTGELQDVGVAQGQVTLTGRRRVSSPPTPIDEAAWQISGEDVLLHFLAHGGERYLGQSGHRTTVHLHLEVEEGNLVWTAIAVRPNAEPFVVRIDGTTGQVMP